MDEHDRLDDEMAELADALMEKRKMQSNTEELHKLDDVMQGLYTLIQPDAPPSTAYREKLTQRLNSEWNMVHKRQSAGWWQQRSNRVLAAAAAIVVVLGAGAIYLNSQPAPTNAGMTGTALGNGGGLVIVALAALAVLAVVWWKNR